MVKLALDLSDNLNTIDIIKAVAIHRIGALEIGDVAVWIGVASAHRNTKLLGCG